MSAFSPEEHRKKIYALLVLKDYRQADLECNIAIKKYPDVEDLYELKLKCLGYIGHQKQVVDFFRGLPFKANKEMLQALGWSVLQTSIHANSSILRRVGLICAFLTQDARSVLYTEKALIDPVRSIRRVAARLTSQMPDLRLQSVLLDRLSQEKDFFVRLDLIEALGCIRGVDGKQPLKKVLTSFSSTMEEKSAATLALLKHDLDEDFFEEHLNSKETHRLLFIIDSIVQLQKSSLSKKLYESLSHFHRDVRATSLISLYFLEESLDGGAVDKMLADNHPVVQMVAAYVLLHIKLEEAADILQKWARSDNKSFSMMANCLIANGGKELVPLMYARFLEEMDPYCKINLSLGLCRNKVYLKEASKFIIKCINNPNFKCIKSPIFRSFFPSILPINKEDSFNQLSYEQIDSMAKLEMVDHLLSLDIVDSEHLLRSFLRHSRFGIGMEALQMLFAVRPTEALDKIENFLNDENLSVRMQAAIICCLFGKIEKAKLVLMADYPKADRETKLNILDALIHIGDEKLNPFFLSILLQEDELLQIAASAGIIRSFR